MSEDSINSNDSQRPMTALGHQWWLFRVVFEMREPPGVQPRAVFVVAIHMAGAIESALRHLGAEQAAKRRKDPAAQVHMPSDADVIACDRSAPVNCVSSSVLFDLKAREAEFQMEVH